MKCNQCGTNNITKANYCIHCGHPFTKEEQQKAYNQTIFGFLDIIENIFNKFSLKFITENAIFRAFVLIGIFSFGIYTMYQNGLEMRILDSEQYEVQYHKETGHYYLLTDEFEISLDLYIPSKSENITITHLLEKDDYIISSQEINIDEPITLEANSKTYYQINSGSQPLKIHIIKE